MKKLVIGTAAVYIEPIQPGVGASHREGRRQREKEAVGRIAQALGISIGHDSDGGPTVDGAYISVSHSMGLAVVAIDPMRPVGVDAEDSRDALWRVRKKFLTERELEEFADEETLLWAWTVKEAVYKAAAKPRPQMTQIECSPSGMMATALGCRYRLHTWLEGSTRVTLAYPDESN